MIEHVDVGTTHWYCDCGEVLNSRTARDHRCPRYERYIKRLIADDLGLRMTYLAEHRLDPEEEVKDYVDDVKFAESALEYFTKRKPADD